MKIYLVKQLIGGILSLVFFLTVIFFLAQIIMPYDFTVTYILSMDPVEREQIQKELGLHLPLWKRYLKWASDLARGDLGIDFNGDSVSARIKQLISPTLLVFGLGSIAAFSLGKWLGSVAAWQGDKWYARAATGSAVTLNTIFPPWFAAVIIPYLARPLYALAYSLQFSMSRRLHRDWLNPDIWGSLKTPEGYAAFVYPTTIMFRMFFSICFLGVVFFFLNRAAKKLWRWKIPGWMNVILLMGSWVASWFASGYGMRALDVSLFAIRPFLAFVLLTFGDTMIIMRTSMQDTLHEDYIMTARAKGLSEREIRVKHASKNAILPAISRFVINLPYLFTGAVIIEMATGWSGLGGTLYGSLYSMNIPLFIGGLVVVGVITLLAQMALEIVQAVMDPRIEEQYRST